MAPAPNTRRVGTWNSNGVIVFAGRARSLGIYPDAPRPESDRAVCYAYAARAASNFRKAPGTASTKRMARVYRA